MRRLLTQLCLLLLLLLNASSISAQQQTRFDYFYLEAEKCRLAGDVSSAMDIYRHLLDMNPDAPEALYMMGILHLGLHEDSIGTDYIRRAATLDSTNTPYQESLAALYLNKGNTQAAIPAVEKLCALQPNRVAILQQLVNLYSTTAQYDKAISTLSRIEVLEGASQEYGIAKFELYLLLHETDSAYSQMQRLFDDAPHDMNLRLQLGSQYMKAGDTLQALALYNEVSQKEPTIPALPLAWLDYYRTTQQDERFCLLRDSLLNCPTTAPDVQSFVLRNFMKDAAADSTLIPRLEAAFDAILARPQQNTYNLELKATWQLYRKVPDDSICQTLLQMLDVEPGNESALHELLGRYISKEDTIGIEDISRRGLNYHPEEISYAYYLSIVLCQQKKDKEAIEVLQQGLRVRDENTQPELVSACFLSLGDIYYTQKRAQEAFAAYDSALVYNEDNALCLNNYAYYLCLQNTDLDRAEEMSYRSVRLDPDNLNSLDTYAWILFMKEDYAHARTYINNVVPPSKSDDELLADSALQGILIEHAGDIYSMLGQQATALRLWMLAQQKHDDSCTPLLRKKIKKKKFIK